MVQVDQLQLITLAKDVSRVHSSQFNSNEEYY